MSLDELREQVNRVAVGDEPREAVDPFVVLALLDVAEAAARWEGEFGMADLDDTLSRLRGVLG